MDLPNAPAETAPAGNWVTDPAPVDVPSPDWLSTAAGEVALFDRSSTAERVAAVLRARITAGDLRPGARLSEEQLVAVLSVSRNTLRETFRLLTHEGLLVHRLHRGVFVRELTEADLVDIYRVRRAIEGDVLRRLEGGDTARFRLLEADVAAGEEAAARGDWPAVGTANMHVHQHLVAMAGSPRLDETTDRMLAELRLAFHTVASPQRLHEPYVRRNRELVELLLAGRFGTAADQLETYLRDSEAQLLAAYRERAA